MLRLFVIHLVPILLSIFPVISTPLQAGQPPGQASVVSHFIMLEQRDIDHNPFISLRPLA